MPERARRLATIDVGTNTALLLVAEVSGGQIVTLHEEQRFVRLGQGVDASGRIREDAVGRLLSALGAYREVAETHGVEGILVGATSASRDAENREEVAARVRSALDLPYEILSGEEEALWSFVGAASAFPGLQGPCAVIDIGGGSTELIVGNPSGDAAGAGGGIAYRCSLDVGSVRITERFFSEQPPSASAVEAAETFIRASLSSASPPLDPSVPLIGAAGTATTLGLVSLGASDRRALAGGVALAADEVRRWRERLLALTFDEVLAIDPEVLTGRADVFPAGVLILDAVLRHGGLPGCRVSPRSLCHGLALRWLRGGEAHGA